jgi:Tfp pilus assembly protein PilO
MEMNAWGAAAAIGSILVVMLGIIKIMSWGIRKPCEEKFEQQKQEQKTIMGKVEDMKKVETQVELLRQEIGWVKQRMTEMEKSLGRMTDKLQLIYLEMPKRKTNGDKS